ncbi:hypothetical protein [Streptomyces sp. NBC_01537]|uniref:hypothetical protein n=1 Tax=Streptomyces sp. NBC_01537 TaxID=2903896 RepID=UPI0038682B7D
MHPHLGDVVADSEQDLVDRCSQLRHRPVDATVGLLGRGTKGRLGADWLGTDRGPKADVLGAEGSAPFSSMPSESIGPTWTGTVLYSLARNRTPSIVSMSASMRFLRSRVRRFESCRGHSGTMR